MAEFEAAVERFQEDVMNDAVASSLPIVTLTRTGRI
jgi:hypothetical protein